MSSRRYSRYTTSSHQANHQTEDSATHQRRHYSRYTDYEDSPPSRRRRWAAGYIDSRSCPSYDYIDTSKRHKVSDDEDEDASDVEYIRPRRERHDEFIESRGYYRSSVSHSSTRNARERSPPQQPVRSSGRARESETQEPSASNMYITEPHNRSSRYHIPTPQTPPPISAPASGEGSPILATSLDLASDIVSLRSGRSSSIRSGRAASEASYVQLRREKKTGSDSDCRSESGSDSDDDGDYISLDEYIAGGSECNSARGVEGHEDGGEGSDAVGSDVDVRSEVGEGSDVASIGEGEGYGSDSEDEEDCIEGRWGGYYRSYGRR